MYVSLKKQEKFAIILGASEISHILVKLTNINIAISLFKLRSTY